MQKYKFKLINKMKVVLCFIILTFYTKKPCGVIRPVLYSSRQRQ